MGNTPFLRFSVRSRTVTPWGSITINVFETDPWDTRQAERQQVRSLMLQFCNANRTVEGLSLLFIIILLSLKFWHWKIWARLKLGRQKNPCPQQEWIVKSKPTKNTKARDEPEAAGVCAYVCVCAPERGTMESDRQKSWKNSSQNTRATSRNNFCASSPQDNLCMLDLNYLWNGLFLQKAQREISLFQLKIQNYPQ